MKLNLGCKTRPIPGFVNMDFEEYPTVDVVGDVSDLSRFKDESIEEIYASHILEHFKSPQTVPVLKEWFRVLKPGGILYVATPDFKRAIEMYDKVGLSEWLVYYMYGDQLHKGTYHYTTFDEKRMDGLLKKVGFAEVSRVVEFPYNQEDCSTLISGIDSKSISLNMIAIK